MRETTKARCRKVGEQIAENLPHHWKHVTLLLRKNTCVAIGFNLPFKTHPMSYKENYRYYALHSEVKALSLYKGEDYESLTLVNMRFHKGQLKLSKPCEICQKLIKKFGIRKVYYTDNNQFVPL